MGTLLRGAAPHVLDRRGVDRIGAGVPCVAFIAPRSDGLKWSLAGRSHARQCLLTRGLLPMLSAPGPSGDEVRPLLEPACAAVLRRGGRRGVPQLTASSSPARGRRCWRRPSPRRRAGAWCRRTSTSWWSSACTSPLSSRYRVRATLCCSRAPAALADPARAGTPERAASHTAPHTLRALALLAFAQIVAVDELGLGIKQPSGLLGPAGLGTGALGSMTPRARGGAAGALAPSPFPAGGGPPAAHGGGVVSPLPSWYPGLHGVQRATERPLVPAVTPVVRMRDVRASCQQKGLPPASSSKDQQRGRPGCATEAGRDKSRRRQCARQHSRRWDAH